jgi:hypothetical protein
MTEKKVIGSAMRFADRPRMKGILKYTVFKNDVPLETVEDHNLIVNVAREQMAHLIAGDEENRQIAKIAFGTSGITPVVSDTAITNPFIKNIISHTYPEQGQVCFNWELLVTEDNGMAILEFGLLTEDGGLFSRRIRENPIYKESDISIEGQWTIIF